MAASFIEPYAAIGVTVLLALMVCGGMLLAAHVLGPKRYDPVKHSPYESGVAPVGDTHRRFNIRFYLVAMLFLLFDVELAFVWPWAQAFYQSAVHGTVLPLQNGDSAGKGFLLAGMGLFFALLTFGLIYEWKKGAFEWDQS